MTQATYRIAFSEMSLANKIPPGDPLWGKFNGSFTNLEVTPLEIANFVYMGHPFTTWHKDNWRHTDNYLLGQHIGLDFDTEDERSTLKHLAQDKFIARYANLIYTTPNHAPEAPRARVVFTLDTPIHQAKNYIAAATAMVWLFGTADTKCKDAVRFFYGSRHCEVEMLSNVLPLDVVKGLIRRYQETGTQTKRSYQPTGDVDADKLVQSVISKAAHGERNSLGFWLACKLAENGLPRSQAEDYMRQYQRAVTHLGNEPYTEQEALASVNSAYRRVTA